MTFKPIYQGNEFEVLKVRYQEHAEYVRRMDESDWKLIYSFLTAQLLMGGWFGQHQLPLQSAYFVALIDTAFLLCAVMLCRTAEKRRNHVVEIIWRINQALGLTEKGAYLPNATLSPHPPPTHIYLWYYLLMTVSTAGAALIIVLPR